MTGTETIEQDLIMITEGQRHPLEVSDFYAPGSPSRTVSNYPTLGNLKFNFNFSDIFPKYGLYIRYPIANDVRKRQ